MDEVCLPRGYIQGGKYQIKKLNIQSLVPMKMGMVVNGFYSELFGFIV